jgi:hypothetical protein
MLWHFGQATICPTAAALRTFSRAPHVVQDIENRSMAALARQAPQTAY